MSDGNILAAYVTAPNATAGKEGVARPCNLRGFWVLTGSAVGAMTIQLRNGTGVTVSDEVLMAFDVANLGTAADESQFGMTLPGNGIRFDTGLWVQGEDTNTITSITLFYQ